jgi:hypothetical protein
MVFLKGATSWGHEGVNGKVIVVFVLVRSNAKYVSCTNGATNEVGKKKVLG